MIKRRAFTLIELLVVVAIIALLISILLPSLANARKHARTTICMTNERNLVTAYRIYFEDSATVLNSTGHGNSGAWDFQLLAANSNLTPLSYYTNNGRGAIADRPRFCPETTTSRRYSGPQVGTASLGWDCRVGPGGGSTGSYAMNDWLYNSASFFSRSGPVNSADFYRLKSLRGEFGVPVFVDAVWHDILPRPTDVPGSNLQDPENGTSADRNLGDAAIDRHSKAVNVGFWDDHVETIKMPKLWTLKWSATWTNTSTPYIP